MPGPCYAELAPVLPIAVKNLISLPHDLPSDLATVADPFACALNGIEVLDVDLGDTVVILRGPADRLLAGRHGARPRGGQGVPERRQPRRLDVALRAVGRFVDDTWVAGGEDNGVSEVMSRTGGTGAARVSVAAPSKQAQQAALEMAAKRARVVYFAGLPSTTR